MRLPLPPSPQAVTRGDGDTLVMYGGLTATASLVCGTMVALLGMSLHHILVLVIAVVVLTPIAWRIALRRFDPFEPVVIFSVVFFTMFVARPLTELASGELIYQRPSRVIDVGSTFTKTLVIALLASIAFLVGYENPLGKRWSRQRSASGTYHLDSIVVSSMGILTLGIMALALFIRQGGGLAVITSGRSEGYYTTLQLSSTYILGATLLMVPSSLILLTVGCLRRQLGVILLGAAGASLLLLQAVALGSRMTLLPFFTCCVVAYCMAKHRRPGRFFLVVLACIGLFVSPILVRTRDSGDLGAAIAQTAERPGSMFDLILKSGDAEMSLTLAAALQVVPPQGDYTLGRSTVGDLLVRPIPREWWPDKPESPRFQLISELWPFEYSLGVANPEFSALLWYYMDFGLFGVIGAMFFYGLGARAAYQYFLMHSRDVRVWLLYGLGLGFLAIALRDSPVDTLIRAVFIIAPVWVVFRLSGERSQEVETLVGGGTEARYETRGQSEPVNV